MSKIWLWILIAVIFGIIAGIVFNYSAKSESENDDDGEDTNRSHILLTILVFSVIGFLIVWLVSAMMDWTI
ncbi:MAG: hypothetical protein RR061_05430 [Muribaculaceae bacterium]